jgi:hypothetical protein
MIPEVPCFLVICLPLTIMQILAYLCLSAESLHGGAIVLVRFVLDDKVHNRSRNPEGTCLHRNDLHDRQNHIPGPIPIVAYRDCINYIQCIRANKKITNHETANSTFKLEFRPRSFECGNYTTHDCKNTFITNVSRSSNLDI